VKLAFVPKAFEKGCFMSPLHNSELVDLIIRWLREAGQIALQLFENVGHVYKADRTLVTQADIEIEALLTERIEQTFPTHGLIAEESAGARVIKLSDIIWVIDPLDGTTAFSQGLPGWGTAIGILAEGEPIAGFYYMPLLNDLTYTTAQGEVYCNGRCLTATMHTDWGQKGYLALTAKAHTDFQIDIALTRALGSNGTSLIYTARGSATAAFLPKAYVWDLVAGAAIMNKLGGELRYLDGAAVNYWALLDGRLAPQPIVAGHPHVLKSLPNLIKLR
jgi:myo-inositol-1(or 4)-monophosphatase